METLNDCLEWFAIAALVYCSILSARIDKLMLQRLQALETKQETLLVQPRMETLPSQEVR